MEDPPPVVVIEEGDGDAAVASCWGVPRGAESPPAKEALGASAGLPSRGSARTLMKWLRGDADDAAGLAASPPREGLLSKSPPRGVSLLADAGAGGSPRGGDLIAAGGRPDAAPPPPAAHARRLSWPSLGRRAKAAPDAAEAPALARDSAGSWGIDLDRLSLGVPPPGEPPAGPAPADGGEPASPRAAGGYRRLWQSFTARRDAGGAGAPPAPAPAEASVDAMAAAIARLKPGRPVASALERALPALDSRAAAALLKELPRRGLAGRAAELFDAMRGAPHGSPLAGCCDVFTYTTAVSQCGSRAALGRALDLVDEMRARGVRWNVHTACALMAVCAKAGETRLALDVHARAAAEGLDVHRNAVCANILIDVHAREGRWAAAVGVLDAALASRGGARPPEARTFNTVICACARAGRPDDAYAVYERMRGAGLAPTGSTYTAVVSAFGRAGRVDEALAFHRRMVREGCELNVITYSSVIGACERAARVDDAWAVFEEMEALPGCRPNLVTFNALLGACAAAGDAARAADAVARMRGAGCRPDAVTHSLLVSANERAGRWGAALAALDAMGAAGCRPDACVTNCAAQALWAAGGAAQQARAAQLVAAAWRGGALRAGAAPPAGAPAAAEPGALAVAAYTPGTALLAALLWLGELAGSRPAGRAPAAAAAAAAPHAPATLVLVRGKHARADQTLPPVRAALEAALAAFSAPVALRAAPQGLALTATPAAATAWASTSAGAALMSLVAPAAARVPPTKALLATDAAAAAQCAAAFGAVRELELRHGPATPPAGPAEELRRQVVSFISALGGSLPIAEETVHDAIALGDRLLAAPRGAALAERHGPARAAAALLLAACRQSGEAERALGAGGGGEVLLALGLGGGGEVRLAQEALAAALGGDLATVSPLRVLHLFLERCGYPASVPGSASQAWQLVAMAAAGVVAKAALHAAFAGFAASVVAAAALLRARECCGLAAWPTVLRELTGLDAADAELARCLQAMHLLGIAS